MKTQTILVLFMGIILLLTNVVTFAAGDRWIMIKDKDNVCKVVKAQQNTANAIAVTRKEHGEAALDEACPKSTVQKLIDKAAEGMKKAKAEAEKLKEKAAPASIRPKTRLKN